MSTTTIQTTAGTRAIARAGDPAQDVQYKLAQIRHLSYAAIREIVMATQHAEQSIEILPCDHEELASARDAIEQAAILLADAAAWLALLAESGDPATARDPWHHILREQEGTSEIKLRPIVYRDDWHHILSKEDA